MSEHVKSTPALFRRNGRRGSFRVRLLLERRAQQPVSLQALHQIVRIHHCLRDRTEHVRVHLNLCVQVACDARKVVERQGEILEQLVQVRVRVRDGLIRIRQCRIEILLSVRAQCPFAQRARPTQLRRERCEVCRCWLRVQSHDVEVGGECGAVAEDGGDLVREVENAG